MTNEELLNEIQKAKLLDADKIAKLKRDALLSGQSVEALISSERLVDGVKIAELKSTILKVPYKKLEADKIDKGLFGLIPEEVSRTYATVPISRSDDLLVIGMVHPDDVKAQDALKFLARRNQVNLGVYLISWEDWQTALRVYSPFRSEVDKAVKELGLSEGSGGQKVTSLEESADVKEGPIVSIVADTFKEAVLSRASDIHIEPQQTYLRVRFRVDGDLKEAAALPLEISRPVISRIKIISNLKIDENRMPQDGRFRARIFDREIDFRVATFPTPLGEKVAIRVLDPTTGLKNFESLDLLFRNREAVQQGIEKPYGMILVTGPTGSGKSTTLYALLQTLNKENVNIVSLEDPVEYFVSGLNQSQVRPEIGYDFASGLRQILRQDPDVIMVGEIRDGETAGLAIQAALTGHVVLSTLHTNNSAGVIPRLIDMKIEPFLLPVSLNLIIAQRLVGRLCQDCRVAEDATPQVQALIKKTLSELTEEIQSQFKEPYQVSHSGGCDKCRGKGVVGRMALFEVFSMSPQVEEIITSGPTIQKILKEAKRQGMITLRQDGVLKALQGKVSLEEVIEETEDL